MKICNNDVLKVALKDSKEIINTILNDNDFDDEQLHKVFKYNNLPQLYKDVIFLTSQYSISDVAKMYNVSRQYIYKILNKINNILK